jgi:hypothetical protein
MTSLAYSAATFALKQFLLLSRADHADTASVVFHDPQIVAAIGMTLGTMCALSLPFPAARTALANHVLSVVRNGPYEKMLRITTSRRIALVADDQIAIVAKCKPSHFAMCLRITLLHAVEDVPITLFRPSPDPQQTTTLSDWNAASLDTFAGDDHGLNPLMACQVLSAQRNTSRPCAIFSGAHSWNRTCPGWVRLMKRLNPRQLSGMSMPSA